MHISREHCTHNGAFLCQFRWIIIPFIQFRFNGEHCCVNILIYFYIAAANIKKSSKMRNCILRWCKSVRSLNKEKKGAGINLNPLYIINKRCKYYPWTNSNLTKFCCVFDAVLLLLLRLLWLSSLNKSRGRSITVFFNANWLVNILNFQIDIFTRLLMRIFQGWSTILHDFYGFSITFNNSAFFLSCYEVRRDSRRTSFLVSMMQSLLFSILIWAAPLGCRLKVFIPHKYFQ